MKRIVLAMSNHLKHCRRNHELTSFQLSDLFREQKSFQSRPETYNGAERDLYSWTQTISDLDVRIKVKLDSDKILLIIIFDDLDSENDQKRKRSESHS